MPEKSLDSKPPLVCIHCKRTFRHGHALMAHLAHCPERKLTRRFVVGDYRFEVIMNPLKRHVTALRKLETELKGVNPEKAFVGALMVFQNAGFIHSFSVKKKDGAKV